MQEKAINASKIVSKTDFKIIRDRLRSENKKVIHCHGVFDLLHPGHIDHLLEAKGLGDVLVVSVTSSPYVNKGPGRPYFNDELRLKTLAALECVDYVLLSEAVTVMDIVEVIQPDLYVKGAEYSNSSNDITQNIDKEVEKVRSYGGDVHYTDDKVVFSSTKLINNNFPVFPPKVLEFTKELSSRHTFKQIREMVDGMEANKVLVVGDIIIDQYTFCNVQGLMSKDRAFSARYEREETYLGGALAVARHLAGFSRNVTVCSVVGDDPAIHSKILNDLSRDMFLDLQYNSRFKTVVKRRFIERHGIRNEYDKLFSINYLNEDDENGLLDKSDYYAKLEQNIGNYDMVVIADFGHGLVDRTVMDIVQDKAKFLAVNCQTNSSNYGTNLITKYRRADTFTLDEKELRLAMTSKHEEVSVLLAKLMRHFNGKNGWVTLGSFGAMGIEESESISTCPALTLTVQDTVGAGDAYFSLASLCALNGLPLEVGTFLGNTAGALAANVLGNARSVGKADLLKFASTLMNF